MRILQIDKSNAEILFEYWNLIGNSIPYFYKTTYESFIKSLFDDAFKGITMFKKSFVYAAMDGNQVIGFIQYGIPKFHINYQGEIIQDTDIGIVRNLYYDKEKCYAGEKLLSFALNFFKNEEIEKLYAFYHVMGMSCNGNHGKLHNDYNYITDLFFDNGFNVEHENVYYICDMHEKQSKDQTKTSIEIQESSINIQKIELMKGEEKIGDGLIKYLDDLTGMKDEDKIYLKLISINKDVRGTGTGTEFINQIISYCVSKGYRYMHLDTALNNVVAQKFYDRNGFKNMGITRSFLRILD